MIQLIRRTVLKEVHIQTFWKVVYKSYPPVLRVLEKVRFHAERQPFLQGSLNPQYSLNELREFLVSQGYSTGVLSWRDPGEVLNLRLLEGKLYQYHIRVFEDGEIRAHYEYSSEGNPIGHILESIFEPRHEHFQKLLEKFLK